MYYKETMTYHFDTTYTKLNSQLFQRVSKPVFTNPRIILINLPLIQKLGISYAKGQPPENLLGATCSDQPFAQAYAGHQFGYFVNLGDGRAMILGEHITPTNERFDIQLKGSGTTNYSRGGDGKATVSSMLREYLYSYAMSNLQIDTSQSLAVLTTNQTVLRKRLSEGAVLIRVMKSHIRFGTFEYIAQYGSQDDLRALADYTIDRHYPQWRDDKLKYVKFFQAVIRKTIDMVVAWHRVGFIHGVMNTDNMSITGETFDYGPCAFMNGYDPATTFSEIDSYKRYAFGNQRAILQWNLSIFGKALLPLFAGNSALAEKRYNSEMEAFDAEFDAKYLTMMKNKLGITSPEADEKLIDAFLKYLEENHLDYTNTFVELMYPNSFDEKTYQAKAFLELRSQLNRVGLNLEMMQKNNPQRILRNHLIEAALDEYENSRNLAGIDGLLKALANPYQKNDALTAYQQPPAKDYDESYTTHCNT